MVIASSRKLLSSSNLKDPTTSSTMFRRRRLKNSVMLVMRNLTKMLMSQRKEIQHMNLKNLSRHLDSDHHSQEQLSRKSF